MEEGVTFKGITGGAEEKTYWTPDGREVHSIPAIRSFQTVKDGKVIKSGTRDANLDKGWLLSPPDDPKLRCVGCDKWHDTEIEIDKCVAVKEAKIAQYSKVGREELKKSTNRDTEITQLRNDMDTMMGMLKKLLDAK